MSSTEEANKIVVLKTIDGLTFEVEHSVVVQFESIKHMFQDNLAGAFIPLPNIKSEILTKVIEYCKRHAKDTTDEVLDEEDLKAFDADFVNVEHHELFDMILAANYLNIRSLLDLTCQTVADMIKGKTAEEIANFFNIRVENTPEEQVETRRETAWAFE